MFRGNRFIADPQPLGNKQSGPPPDPKLYATYDGALGDPASPALTLARAIVARTPVRSVVSYQLFTHQSDIGALNLYSFAPHGFSSSAVELGYAFATQAALALDSARKQENFDSALASRDIIGQSKGIIMERFDVGATRAFEMLVALSQDMNVSVAELSRRLVSKDHPDLPK